MKNIKIISIFFLAFIAWGCDPLDEEIKKMREETAANEFVYIQDVEHTLTDDDYDFLDVGSSFRSEEDVKIKVPVLLSELYPYLGKNSSALVHYKYYNGSGPDLRGTHTEFTIPSEDYDLFHGYDGFDNLGNPDQDVVDYVNWKGFEGEDGDYIDVTFDYYNNGFHGGAVSRIVYTVAYGWQYAWPVPDEAYDAFGESKSCFGVYDFSYHDEAASVMHHYLNEYKTFLHEEGDVLVVQYNFDNGDDCNDDIANGPLVDPTEQDVVMYVFNGSEWKAYYDAGFQVTEETLNFGHDGTTWVPDNTIKYTVTADDGAEIGGHSELANAAAITNIAQYKNFGTDWTHEEIVVAIDFILKLRFPASEVGQKFFVTYNTYPDGDKTISLILDANGNYVEQ